MKIIGVKNLVWSNAEKTAFECVVTTDDFGDVPFTASSTDKTDHGKTVFEAGVAGDYGVIKKYVPVVSRDALVTAAQNALYLTDRVQLRCLKAGVTFPDEWVAYYKAVLAIYNGTDKVSTSLPTAPKYPSGT